MEILKAGTYTYTLWEHMVDGCDNRDGPTIWILT